MFKTTNAPKIPRALGETIQLLMTSSAAIVYTFILSYPNMNTTSINTESDIGFLILLAHYFIVFMVLVLVIIMRIIPYLYTENEAIFIYNKGIFRKPFKIQVTQIKQLEIHKGTGFSKGTFKLIFHLDDNSQLEHTIGMYSGKKFYALIKNFFENDAKIKNIKTL